MSVAACSLAERLLLIRSVYRIDAETALALSEFWRQAWPLVCPLQAPAPQIAEAQFPLVFDEAAEAAVLNPLRAPRRRHRLAALLDACSVLAARMAEFEERERPRWGLPAAAPLPPAAWAAFAFWLHPLLFGVAVMPG